MPSDLIHSGAADTDTLVLVDDELSTGATARGTIAAVHHRQPRSRYVVACLIDLRSPGDEQRMRDLAANLGCRIDVVSLSRGRVELPDGLLAAVGAEVAAFDRGEPVVATHRSEVAAVRSW